MCCLSYSSLSETASDQVHEATSTSTVDNEVISTPAESNLSVPVPNLENVSPTNASGERVLLHLKLVQVKDIIHHVHRSTHKN